ncbi:hypothetical protein [uncultured Amphritea sp.]|uniref:hypothetical protein n=1 Tax=uncultured Amphritea sp. TaxID=981605 RepID=UPI00261001A2|nr:hypothetical protein [uncultured Amphritea sp.]
MQTMTAAHSKLIERIQASDDPASLVAVIKESLRPPGSLRDLVATLQEAWTEMKKFGSHDGDCNKEELCEACSTPLKGCGLHQQHVNGRIAAMDAAVGKLTDVSQ